MLGTYTRNLSFGFWKGRREMCLRQVERGVSSYSAKFLQKMKKSLVSICLQRITPRHRRYRNSEVYWRAREEFPSPRFFS